MFPSRSERAWQVHYEELLDILKQLVNNLGDPAVAVWADEGGPASIRYNRGLLIANQTTAAHAKIERLLADLRAARRPVTVEAEWVLLDPEVYVRYMAGPAARPADFRPDRLEDARLAFRGALACQDSQEVPLVATTLSAYVKDTRAALGESSATVGPDVAALPGGIDLRIRPTLSGDAARVDVQVVSWVGLEATFRSRQVAGPAASRAAGSPVRAEIDLPKTRAIHVATIANGPTGRFFLVHAASLPGEEGAGKVLCLFVRVTPEQTASEYIMVPGEVPPDVSGCEHPYIHRERPSGDAADPARKASPKAPAAPGPD
jgi:hypothetical protein